jgi:cytochrome c peroxidase
LEQAVRDMARYQSGVELSDEQVAQIVAFLETLTGQYEGKVLTNSNSQK